MLLGHGDGLMVAGEGGGSIAQWIAFALLNPVAPGSNPSVPDNLLLMLPRFIAGAAA